MAAIITGVFVVVAWGAFVFETLPRIWMPALATLLPLWPLLRWARIRTRVMTLTGDQLRLESGLIGRSTRTLLLSRIQDVVVSQSLWNRIFNVGDIRIETAGASGHVFLHDVDSPHQVAQQILERSRAMY